MSSSTDSVALACVGVEKAFGPHVVLDGVDLEVAPGGITAILGPSGGGKTTLLRLVAGFETADAGTIRVHGATVEGEKKSVPPERRRVGYVPQEGALFPHLSVGANVGFGLRRSSARAARIAECLELVDLAGSERARPHELSGGQQQRVALARALAPHPEVVLLDEPFSSLDTGLRAQVRTEVCDALQRAGATAVLVTHDQQEALAVSREVAVLLGGRIAQVADPVTLYRAPATLEVATFVGDAVVAPGEYRDGFVECVLGRLACTVRDDSSSAVSVVVRPEQISIDDRTGSVPAHVLARAFLGADALVDLQLTGSETPVRARVGTRDLPEVGAAVCVSVTGPVVAFAR